MSFNLNIKRHAQEIIFIPNTKRNIHPSFVFNNNMEFTKQFRNGNGNSEIFCIPVPVLASAKRGEQKVCFSHLIQFSTMFTSASCFLKKA